ncbi:MAG TPA: hypothetical protein VF365_02700 [Candidatus Limnocylindria bacterium]
MAASATEPTAAPPTALPSRTEDPLPVRGGNGSDGGGAAVSLRLPVPDGLLPYLVLTSAGLGWFLFLVGWRRTNESAPAAALVTAGAVTGGTPPVMAATQLRPIREPIPPVHPGLPRDDDDDRQSRADEADIPRWLRPSVRQARFQGSHSTRNDTWD